MKFGYLILGVVIVLVVAGIFYFNYGMNDTDSIKGVSSVDSYIDLSTAEAKQLIEDPEVVVIDVSPYYDEGHLPGAINYYPSSELDDAIPGLDKSKTYLVYCHADGPSRNGAQKLVDAGFENVYRLESHFGGWRDAGYDIEV